MDYRHYLQSIEESHRPRALMSVKNTYIAVSKPYCKLWNISERLAKGSNLSRLRKDVADCQPFWDEITQQVIADNDRHSLMHLIPPRNSKENARIVSCDVFPSISDDGTLRGIEISEKVVDQNLMRCHFKIATNVLSVPGVHRLSGKVDWSRLSEPKLRETLFWLSWGLSLKEMAAMMRITERGLAKRLEHLRELTHASSASMLRFWAIQQGFSTFIPSRDLSRVISLWLTAPKEEDADGGDFRRQYLIA